MAGRKKNSLSRDQAMELYDDLERAMSSLLGPKAGGKPKIQKPVSPQVARNAYKPAKSDAEHVIDQVKMSLSVPTSVSGAHSAITLLLVVGLLKLATTVIDASGVFSVEPVQASLHSQNMTNPPAFLPKGSAEERKILLALDERRAELEERSRKLEEHENDLSRRDQEAAARLTELREMTNALKLDRDKSDKKRSTQIEQLANVYGSMDPKEAASLIEQLDITIALGLLQKMPEKRIAQILALMSPERALAITRTLSGMGKAQ